MKLSKDEYTVFHAVSSIRVFAVLSLFISVWLLNTPNCYLTDKQLDFSLLSACLTGGSNRLLTDLNGQTSYNFQYFYIGIFASSPLISSSVNSSGFVSLIPNLSAILLSSIKILTGLSLLLPII